MNESLMKKYFRMDKLPHIWCPGCGNGIALSTIVEAVEGANINDDEICFVSGIGCSSRATGYLNFDTIHTTHGRAIPFATGIKLFNPKMKTLVISGDGDCTAIGGNHFIHGCRRNMDITVIVFNNNIYGMTGGQYSPTTPYGGVTATTQKGSKENEFDICKLAISAGASFVARSTVYHYNHLRDTIKQGILNDGFSVIEVLTPCPVQFGRRNNMAEPGKCLRNIVDSVSFTDDKKIKLGIFKNGNINQNGGKID